MDKSKHGEAGSRVLESQTVSFYQSVQFVKDVEGESWGLKGGCDAESYWGRPYWPPSGPPDPMDTRNHLPLAKLGI